MATLMRVCWMLLLLCVSMDKVQVTHAVSCTDPCYYYDEGPTGNRCTSNCDCDGQRTCSAYNWCQGSSRPNGCTAVCITSLTGYTFYQGLDSGGNDIRNSASRPASALAVECSADASCQGFNTNGWLKHTLKQLGRWTRFSNDKCHGTFVKDSVCSRVKLFTTGCSGVRAVGSSWQQRQQEVEDESFESVLPQGSMRTYMRNPWRGSVEPVPETVDGNGPFGLVNSVGYTQGGRDFVDNLRAEAEPTRMHQTLRGDTRGVEPKDDAFVWDSDYGKK